MAKKSVKEILAEVMPDMEIVEGTTPRSSDVAQTTRPGPSIEELRKKYLGVSAAPGEEADAADEASDVEVVQVRPKAGSADLAAPAAPKTVIVSKTRGIIGRQG